MQSTRGFKYKSLASGNSSIRLLHVETSSDAAEPIRCIITHVDLDSHPRPEFDALSYTWDKIASHASYDQDAVSQERKSQHTHAISCSYEHSDDQTTLDIQESLHDFLLRFRSSQWERPRRKLWVDAVCINQRDESEKDQQINNVMQRVYYDAETVLVWLGEATEQSVKGLAFLLQLPNQAPLPVLPFNHRGYVLQPASPDSELPTGQLVGQNIMSATRGWTDWIALLDILWREYFQRSWVVQEILLARELHFFIGNFEVPAALLLRGIGRYRSLRDMPFYYSTYRDDRDGILSLPYILQAREDFRQGKRWPLAHCIDMVRDRSAADPKDKVYCILAIAEETSLEIDSPKGSSGDHMQLRAGIARKAETVYLDCTKAILRQTSLSYILSIVGRVGGSLSPALPSWIPDFSAPLRPKPFSFFYGTDFAAATELSPAFSISSSGTVLTLSAAPLDSITKIAESFTAFDTKGFYSTTGGHMLDLILAVGKTYRPTGESTMQVFRRTMTASVFRAPSNFSAKFLDDKFYSWLFEKYAMGFLSVLPGWKPWLLQKFMRVYGLAVKYFQPTGQNEGDKKLTARLELDLQALAGRFWKTFYDGDLANLPRFPDWYGDATEVHRVIDAIYRDRRLFLTAQGYLGIGSSELDIGDQVVLAAGVDTPLILRPKSGPQEFALVGTAYVHGIMNGEAVKASRFRHIEIS